MKKYHSPENLVPMVYRSPRHLKIMLESKHETCVHKTWYSTESFNRAMHIHVHISEE